MLKKSLELYRYYKTLFSLEQDDVKRLVRRFLPTNPVILEAGAHVGFDTAQMAMVFPMAKIHAFEPIPHLFEKLRENTANFKNVSTYHVALGQSTGQASINVSEGEVEASSSLLTPKDHIQLFPNIKFEKSLIIDTITLDEWAIANKINRIDFMWLDMQGYEITALEAGLNILGTVKTIFIEVSLVEMYENAPLLHEIEAWMNKHGFALFKNYMRPGEMYGEALFIREH